MLHATNTATVDARYLYLITNCMSCGHISNRRRAVGVVVVRAVNHWIGDVTNYDVISLLVDI